MRDRGSIWNQIQQLTGLFLLTLIMSVSVIQFFHSHTKEHRSHKGGASEYSIAVEKCQICDFLVHKHQKEFILPQAYLILLSPASRPAFQIPGTVSFYEFTLGGFTNKGPPVNLSSC
jgi:hypothetical protein